MGTTDNFGLPYPEPSDFVIDGDDSVKALAEAVDAAVTPTWIVSKTASETVVSSTAFQDDNHLFFTVEANAIYVVDFELLWESSAALSGFQARWLLPAGSNVYGHSLTRQGSATPLLFATRGDWFGDYMIGNGEQGYGIGSTDILFTAGTHKLVIGGTAGTAKVQWAQHSVHATNTRLFAESFLRIQRVA